MLAEQGTCAWCARLAVIDDHIIPLAWGGARDARDNHQGMCDACHKIKTQAEARASQLLGSHADNARLRQHVLDRLGNEQAELLSTAYESAICASDRDDGPRIISL